MSELLELKEGVGKAGGPDRDLDAAIASALFGWPIIEDAFVKGYAVRPGDNILDNSGASEEDRRMDLRFTASIDAALGLAERALGVERPDYILSHTNGGLTIHCQLGPPGAKDGAWGDTAPLAILAALLSALIADQKEG